jgi:hypothetical protein
MQVYCSEQGMLFGAFPGSRLVDGTAAFACVPSKNVITYHTWSHCLLLSLQQLLPHINSLKEDS